MGLIHPAPERERIPEPTRRIPRRLAGFTDRGELVTYTTDDQDDLEAIYLAAGGGTAGIIAVANHAEQQTIERAASSDTLVGVLAGVEHQLTRMADAAQKPAPTITEDSAVAAWLKVLPMYEDKAIPFLEELHIPVEYEPKTRLP